jgi:hypothetical protein
MAKVVHEINNTLYGTQRRITLGAVFANKLDADLGSHRKETLIDQSSVACAE